MSTREACRCQGSQSTDPSARTAKRGTAFKILLESCPYNACDKMGLGRTRFPHGNRTHESHDNDSTKAATGRPDPAAAERARVSKAHEYRFPRRCSRSLRRRPRHIQEVVHWLAGELRHGLCADPASRSKTRKHDGRTSCGPHGDAGCSGRRRHAGRARPRLSQSTGYLSGNRGRHSALVEAIRAPWRTHALRLLPALVGRGLRRARHLCDPLRHRYRR